MVRDVYLVTQEQRIFRYRSSIELTSWLLRDMSVVTYSYQSLQKVSYLRVAWAILADVEAAVRFVGCRPGLVGGMNAMPVVCK